MIEAADGHFVNHACHTPKGINEKVYAAGFTYAMNLRNGLLGRFALSPMGQHGTMKFLFYVLILNIKIVNRNSLRNTFMCTIKPSQIIPGVKAKIA